MIPGLGRSPREGHGNPSSSCLKNPMDRGAWLATVHRVVGSPLPARGRIESGRRRVLASLYWEGPNELPLRRSSRSASRRDIAEPRPRGCSAWASLAKPFPALAFAQGKEQTAEVGETSLAGAFLVAGPLGTPLGSAQWKRASSCQAVGTTWFFSSCGREFRLPLVLAQGSPNFHTS